MYSKTGIWFILICILLMVFIAFLYSNPKRESVSLQRVHTGSIQALILHPDGSHFVSSGYDGKIKLWDLKNHRYLKSMNTEYHDEGDYVIASCSRDSLKKYFLDPSKKPVEILSEFKPGLQNLAFSDDMKTLIYSSEYSIHMIRNFDD